jgi:hypothetical protein
MDLFTVYHALGGALVYTAVVAHKSQALLKRASCVEFKFIKDCMEEACYACTIITVMIFSRQVGFIEVLAMTDYAYLTLIYK